jgi:uncharacterized protein with von Willebrand factor type A (vWA) domain
MQERLENLRGDADAAGQEFEQSMKSGMGAIRQTLRDSIGKAAEEAAQTQQQCDSWGIEPGVLQRMPAEERMALARRLNNDRFKRIADLFGAMRNLMLTEVTRKTIAANEEVFDVQLGNDLDHILPEQLVELKNPETRLEFLRKYAEGELLEYCVDAVTEILTNRGWLTYAEVEIGDQAYGLTEDGLARWTPILDVYRGMANEVIIMKGKSFDSVTTPNHRWLTMPRHSGPRTPLLRWKTTESLNTGDWIPLAAPRSDFPLAPIHKNEFVELVAWFWTEGEVTKVGGSVIGQSTTANADNVSRIDACLRTLYGEPGKQKPGRKPKGYSGPLWRMDVDPDDHCARFHLSQGIGRQLLSVAPNKIVLTSFLSALTEEQLELFIEISLRGDGCTSRGNHRAKNGQTALGQSELARLKAFEIACVLSGRAVSTTGAEGWWNTTILDALRTSPVRAATKGCANPLTIGRERNKQVVWCPTTETGTWLARRNGSVYFTGNSMRGTERKAQGGIILCEDGSGSMHGERELWAKAVMLCLLHLARMQKRPFHLIHFGSPGQFKRISFFDEADFNIDRVLEAAELFFGGGTDFQTPLSKALELLQDEHRSKGAVEGDVVFVTDGMCGIPEQFLEDFKKEQERLDFVVWGVNIAGSRGDEPLATICDGRVATVKDLLSGQDIRQVFAGV